MAGCSLGLLALRRPHDYGDLTTLRNYALRLDSINEDERSVDAVVATEKPTLVFDLMRFEVVEEILRMDGVRLPKQVPMLDSHDRSTIQKTLGSTRNFRVEDGRLMATNVFSSVEMDAFTKVKERHITDNSIGYRVTKFVDIPRGEKRKVGGQVYEAGPRFTKRVSLKWEPKENSILAVGADDQIDILTGQSDFVQTFFYM